MNDKYDLTNSGAQVQEAINAALQQFPNQISSLENNKVDKVSGKGLSTNDYTNTDANKVARLITNGDGSMFLANDGTYKTASGAIVYKDVTGKPILNTDNGEAQTVNASETIQGTISLHRIAKTGNYSDLIGAPIIPTISLNGSNTTTPTFYAPTSGGQSGQYLVFSGGVPTWQNLPTIPTITLNNYVTTSPTFYAPETGGTEGYYLSSTGQTTTPTWKQFPTIPEITLNNQLLMSPSFYAPTSAGTVGYYLVSAGGTNAPVWQPLPTIPTIGTLNTVSSSSLNTNTSESFSGEISLHRISKTGNYGDLNGRPIVQSIGSEEGPVILASLADGTYTISGYYKNNATTTTVQQANGPMLVNKIGNNLSIIGGSKTQVNYNTLNETTWTTQIYNLIQSSAFDSIVVVNEFPDDMLDNVLYMKAEAI